MCLAIPARVVEIDSIRDAAIVSIGNVRKEISLALVEEVAINDYLLIHVGYAINKINTEEAESTLQLFAEAGLL
jgi:hydrogenase expression/formation protein HypC